MKQISISMVFAGLGLATLCIACNPSQRGDDGSDLADDQHEQVFETPEAEADARFIADVVEKNYAEIKLAQLAMGRTNDREVREAAVMLDEDHRKQITELKQIAIEKGISIPVEEDSNARASISDLETKSQADFDKKWLALLLDRHRADISIFELRLKETKDDDLKNWIDGTLPKLRVHMDMLAAYQEQLEK